MDLSEDLNSNRDDIRSDYSFGRIAEISERFIKSRHDIGSSFMFGPEVDAQIGDENFESFSVGSSDSSTESDGSLPHVENKEAHKNIINPELLGKDRAAYLYSDDVSIWPDNISEKQGHDEEASSKSADGGSEDVGLNEIYQLSGSRIEDTYCEDTLKLLNSEEKNFSASLNEDVPFSAGKADIFYDEVFGASKFNLGDNDYPGAEVLESFPDELKEFLPAHPESCPRMMLDKLPEDLLQERFFPQFEPHLLTGSWSFLPEIHEEEAFQEDFRVKNTRSDDPLAFIEFNSAANLSIDLLAGHEAGKEREALLETPVTPSEVLPAAVGCTYTAEKGDKVDNLASFKLRNPAISSLEAENSAADVAPSLIISRDNEKVPEAMISADFSALNAASSHSASEEGFRIDNTSEALGDVHSTQVASLLPPLSMEYTVSGEELNEVPAKSVWIANKGSSESSSKELKSPSHMHEEKQPQSSLQQRAKTPYNAFLELLKHPSCAAIVSSLKNFVESFPDSLSRHDARDKLIPFVSMIHQSLLQTEAFSAYSYTEEAKEVALDSVEKFVTQKLYDRLFARDPLDLQEDERLSELMSSLQWVEPRHLDCCFEISETDLDIAVSELARVSRSKSARDKSVLIINCCRAIICLLEKQSAKQSLDGQSVSYAANDDILPILICAVIRSNLPHLRSQVVFIQNFRHPSRLVKQEEYHFVQFCSAVEFISGLGATYKLNVSPDEVLSITENFPKGYEIYKNLIEEYEVQTGKKNKQKQEESELLDVRRELGDHRDMNNQLINGVKDSSSIVKEETGYSTPKSAEEIQKLGHYRELDVLKNLVSTAANLTKRFEAVESVSNLKIGELDEFFAEYKQLLRLKLLIIDSCEFLNFS